MILSRVIAHSFPLSRKRERGEEAHRPWAIALPFQGR